MKTLITLILLLYSLLCSGQTELLSNGNFNNTSGGWTSSRDFYYNTRFTSYNFSSGYAYLANSNGQRANNLLGDVTSQSFTIPNNTTSATFTFYYSIQTEENNTSKKDWLDVKILDNNNSPLWDVISLSNTDYTSSVNSSVRYQKVSFSVPSYLFGKRVKVHFFGTTNATNPTVFRIDDVSLLVTTGSSGKKTDCITWIGGVVPSSPDVVGAFDNLCNEGLIENSIRAERLASFRIVDAATVTLRALYGGTQPVSIPSDYFPTLFGDIDNLSFEQHRSIKAMCFLEGSDGRPALSRDFSMIQPFKIITPGDVLRMLLEAWNISPRLSGYNINAHTKSSFLDNVYSDDYNYGYIQQAHRRGLIDDYVKNNRLSVNNVGEFFYVVLNRLYIENEPDIDDNDYYHPNNIHLNNASAVRDIKEATFTTYEQSGFDIPSGGFGLQFVYSYHSDWLDMPVNGLNLALTSTYGNYQNERAKQRSFPLGLGWTHTYNIFAQSILDENYEDKYFLIRSGDGSLVVYNVQKGKFETGGIYDSFIEFPRENGHITKFTITSKDFVTTTFEKSSGDSGTDNPSVYIVKEIKDLQGNKLLFDYEMADCKNSVSGCKGTSELRLKSVTDNFGNRSLTFHYGTNSDLLTHVTDNLGRTISFVIDIERLELVAAKDANGFTTQYEYLNGDLGKNLLSAIIRPRGNRIDNSYSQRKLKTTSTPNYLAEIDFVSEYKKSSKTTTTTIYHTQSNNRYSVSYKHNDAGLLQSVKSATEDLDFDYGDSENPTLPTWIDDDNTGIQQEFKYDDSGNILEAIVYNGNLREVNKYTYSLLHKPITHTWPNGTIAKYEYDNIGKKLKETVSTLTTEFGYNSNGTLAWQKDNEGGVTNFGYNQYGNVNLITLGGNTPVTYSAIYDNVSRLVSAVNPNGVQTSYSYDGNDNLKSTTQDPSGLSLLTQYTYDSNNNLVTIKPPLGNETILTYNSNDDLEEERQGYFYKQWRYNEDGTLRSFTNKLFDYFPYEYFKKGDANEGKVKSNGYQNFTYDSKTRLLKSVRSPITGDELRYGYDGLTRVNNVSFTGRGLNSQVGYSYDISGNTTKVSFEGKSISYEYDELNRIKNIKDWNNKKIITYSYTGNNLLKSEEYDNGMVVNYHYDGANRLDSIYSVNKEGKLIHAIGTALDKVGNHLRESYFVKYEKSVPIQGGSGNFPLNYSYSDESRLRQINNRQVIENRNGNILENAHVEFINGIYDIRDNLISCTLLENNKTFLYDPMENRYGNNDTRYIVDYLNNANVLATKKANSSALETIYVHSPFGLVCSLDPISAEPTYYLYDFRGSTVATVDKNQKVIDYYKYDPFGQVSGSSPTYSSSKTPFLFVGKYGVMYESSTFYYMRARYYDARSGRFMSEDPVWGTNLFTYGDNNPLGNIDPSGLFSVTARVGVAESLIPLWGSWRTAMYYADQGNYALAALNTAFAISDVFLVKSIASATMKLAVPRLTNSQLKSISSLEKEIRLHERKLAEYIQNPLKADNRGILKAAKNNVISNSIIQGRINHLRKEIKAFQGKILNIRRGQ